MAKILIAPNAYKGTLTPLQVASSLQEGVELFFKNNNVSNTEISTAPLADGGDGTIEAIHAATGAAMHSVVVRGATGMPSTAHWLEFSSNRAVVELASACGLAALTGKLSPLSASTYGLGQLIQHVVDQNKFNEIIVAVGGSASTDGGSGALAALGAKYYSDTQRKTEIAVEGGGTLSKVEACDLTVLVNMRQQIRFKIVTDVSNPLCGPHGAACVFAPQKGATESQVVMLDQALNKFATVIERACQGAWNRETPGAGAAGGTAFGLGCALQAEILPGFTWVAQTVDLFNKIALADVVITGEGRVDRSTMYGKTVSQLANECRVQNKPLLVVAGSVDESIGETAGVYFEQAAPGMQNIPQAPATPADIARAAYRGLARII